MKSFSGEIPIVSLLLPFSLYWLLLCSAKSFVLCLVSV